MKSLSLAIIALLLFPTTAIAQVNRTVGNKISNLGNITARNDIEAIAICRNTKGGNLVVRYAIGKYTCYYARPLANTYKKS